MKIVESYTRETVVKTKGYRARKSEKLMAIYPTATRVDIAIRGNRQKLQPDPGTVLYIMSTGGKWGKSSQVRAYHTLPRRTSLISDRATEA